MKFNVTRIATSGLFLAIAMILSYIESLIPFFVGIPGIKIGLPNLIVLLILYRSIPDTDPYKAAITINLCRILLTGFLFGNMFSILYSIAGAAFSYFIMVLFSRSSKLSIVGVSILGGVFHNIGQILIAMLLLNTKSILYYISPLMISGAVTGMVLGFVAYYVLFYLRHNHLES